MLSAKVFEFIDTNTWQWNRLKVCETFAPRTRKEILAIPLNRSCSRDCLIWKEKLISKAGREVLIKTIAQVIPLYSMGLFKIPKVVGDSINSILA